MKISVILSHPRPGSFNHAIAGTAKNVLEASGHTVRFHDLYAEGFDPLLPAGEIFRDATLPPSIRHHCAELSDADGLIVVHPNWWGMPPAILKGWIDRVLRPGIAYRFSASDSGDGVPEGLLRVRAALVFNTSNTPAQREQEVFGDPLGNLWKACICAFCGVPVFKRRMFRVMVTSTEAERMAWLDEVRILVQDTFP